MADAYLLETGTTDRYLLEDGSGVYLLDVPVIDVSGTTAVVSGVSGDATGGSVAITRVNSASINASGTTAAAYSTTLGVAAAAGDLIIVNASGNGTHVANGMSVQDSVNLTNFTTITEVQGGGASSHWAQAFYYVTPQALASGTTITLTPYALNTLSSFDVDIFRGTSGAISRAVTLTSGVAGTTAVTPALATAPVAGDLVLSMIEVSTGTATPPAAYTKGSFTVTTASSCIGYVLAADGASTYSGTWTWGTSNTSDLQTVAFGAAAGGPVTLAASGTIPVVATAIGDATRVPLVLAVSGTSAAVTVVSGNATRVGLTLAATGTVVVVSAASGDATRTLLTLAAAGTITATTTVTGDATRVPLTLAASGTAAAVVAVTGNPTIVGASLVLAASGTVPVVAATLGNPTRVPLTLTASGTIPATTAVIGNATLVGGAQTLAASGQITVTSTATGNVTRVVLVAAASGTVAIMATTIGAATRQGLILAVSGTVDAVSVVIGDVAWIGPFPVILHPRLTLTLPTSTLTLTAPTSALTIDAPTSMLTLTLPVSDLVLAVPDSRLELT